MPSTKGEKVELVLEKIGEKVGVPQQIIYKKLLSAKVVAN